MKITVTKRDRPRAPYHACIDDDKKRWSAGNTPASAIGALIATWIEDCTPEIKAIQDWLFQLSNQHCGLYICDQFQALNVEIDDQTGEMLGFGRPFGKQIEISS